jgi:serine/threonine protein kinase
MLLQAGETIPIGGGYKIIKHLGGGAYGEVWQVESPGGFPAAVKIIHRTAGNEGSNKERRALDIIKTLRHPFLLQTLDYQLQDGYLFILIELADGSLRDRLHEYQERGERGIPPGELLQYFREAAEALDYLADQNVLHRDIKPDNLLVSRGHIKVADFGLAREGGAGGSAGRAGPQASIAGTPAYMAPEAWAQEPCRESDQYSLACSWAELRLGRHPFAGVDLVALMLHSQTKLDLSPLEEPERRALLRALARDAAQRYPSCQALVDDLAASFAAGNLRPLPPLSPRELMTSQRVDDQTAPATRPVDQESTPPGSGTVESGAFGTFGTLIVKPPSTAPPVPPPLPPSPAVEPPAPRPEARKAPPKRRKRWLVPVVFIGVFLVGFLLFRSLSPFFRTRDGGGEGPRQSFVVVEPTWPPLGPSLNKVAVRVTRNQTTEPIDLRFSIEGGGLSLPPAVIPAGADRTEIDLRVEDQAAIGPRSVSLEASAGQEKPIRQSFVVHVLPRDWKAEQGTRPEGTPPYYPRLERRVGGERLRLLLIRQPAAGNAFYLSENKISNGVVQEFARAHPEALQGSVWKRGARANGADSGSDRRDLPAFRLTREEAEKVAAWLGGRLPTAKQFDAAAGYWLEKRGPGPAHGPRVAVGRRFEGPRSIEAESDDISPLGVRDLAGNGYEWTRDNLEAGGERLAVLRGRSWTARSPLLYSDLEAQQKPENTLTQYPDRPSAYTGFRVAIELATP